MALSMRPGTYGITLPTSRRRTRVRLLIFQSSVTTLFFSIAIMGLTLWLLYKAAHKATAGVPGKFQCAIEMLVEFE